MKDYLDKLKVDIDYENQPFDNLKINPYEIVIATAKYARELNEKFRKYFGSDYDIQPRNLAVKKLESDNLQLIYEDDQVKTDKLTAAHNKEK